MAAFRSPVYSRSLHQPVEFYQGNSHPLFEVSKHIIYGRGHDYVRKLIRSNDGSKVFQMLSDMTYVYISDPPSLIGKALTSRTAPS